MSDHAEEQVWQHLDTCQWRTYVHARLPRTSCPADGVRQIVAPWAEPRSQITRAYEGRLIDLCKECDVTGLRRLTATGWEAVWGVLTRVVARAGPQAPAAPHPARRGREGHPQGAPLRDPRAQRDEPPVAPE